MADWRPICEVCEERPQQDDDTLCIECRAKMEVHSTVVTDPLEVLLARHLPVRAPEGWVLCLCGVTFGGPAYHRQHVATLIYDLLGLPGPTPHVPLLIAEAEATDGPAS